MVCLYCGAETKVINSRIQKRANQTWRRRRCTKCGATFTTHEQIDLTTSLLVSKSDGSPNEPFNQPKITRDLLSALKDEPRASAMAQELTHTVVQRILSDIGKPIISSKQISHLSAETLKHFSKQAYLRFVAEHPSLHEIT